MTDQTTTPTGGADQAPAPALDIGAEAGTIRASAGEERTGHGHVTPQPGGPARCGGPSRCAVCAEELRVHQEAQDEVRRLEIRDAVTRECGALHSQQAALLGLLCALYPASLAHGTDPTWEILTVETPAGQTCWPVAPKDLEALRHVQWATPRDYDGHNTEERLHRLGATVQEILARRNLAAVAVPAPMPTVPATFIKITIPEGMTEEEMAAKVADILKPAPAPAPVETAEQRAAAAWGRIGAAIADVLRQEMAELGGVAL